MRLSDLEPRFICAACGKRGADVRPNFSWTSSGRREAWATADTRNLFPDQALTERCGSCAPEPRRKWVPGLRGLLVVWGPSDPYINAMPRKPIELPSDFARRFAEDMRAWFAETDLIKRDEIAARQLHALRQHYPGKLRLIDVAEMFLQLKDHA